MRTLSLVLVMGLVACRSAGEGLAASDTGSLGQGKPAAPLVKLGTDPGGAGQGTPLAVRPGRELAAFAAGCFWGVEDAYRHVPGVTATAVGYSGGHTRNPTYDAVCEHNTGHAETLLVEFDPARVTYERLVDIFFQIHDPTTKNRQGPDVGDQYRSAVFTLSPAQVGAARASMARAQGKSQKPIVTEIAPLGAFYKAEAYHQQYSERTGSHGCPVNLKGIVQGT